MNTVSEDNVTLCWNWFLVAPIAWIPLMRNYFATVVCDCNLSSFQISRCEFKIWLVLRDPRQGNEIFFSIQFSLPLTVTLLYFTSICSILMVYLVSFMLSIIYTWYDQYWWTHTAQSNREFYYDTGTMWRLMYLILCTSINISYSKK